MTIDVPCWLDADPPLIHPSDLHKVAEAKDRLRRQNKPLQTGSLIAELHFGFWTTLFDVRYERGGILWPRLFVHGLLNAGSPKSVRTRKALSPLLNRVRHLRNRVFHHEPVWHWRDLHAQHALALDLLAWFSPELHTVLLPQVQFEVVHRAGVAPFRQQVNTLLASDDPDNPA